MEPTTNAEAGNAAPAGNPPKTVRLSTSSSPAPKSSIQSTLAMDGATLKRKLSAPVSPQSLSLPVPPIRVSSPAPPLSESFPALPVRVSARARPQDAVWAVVAGDRQRGQHGHRVDIQCRGPCEVWRGTCTGGDVDSLKTSVASEQREGVWHAKGRGLTEAQFINTGTIIDFSCRVMSSAGDHVKIVVRTAVQLIHQRRPPDDVAASIAHNRQSFD